MADTIEPAPATQQPSRPAPKFGGPLAATAGVELPPSQPWTIPRSGGRPGGALDLQSPVNQNGSFDFDRVLKSGDVWKRSRRTRAWKRFHLVLRPNLLSIYKNADEERLHKQVNLSDLTAVAALKDPKGRRDHMFGLFSPARNFHFQASSAAEARGWVEILSREARIDEEEESMILGSPVTEAPSLPYRSRAAAAAAAAEAEGRRRSTSSPEPHESSSPYITRDGVRIPGIRRTSFQEQDYSGAEHASYSDFSDANNNPGLATASQHGTLSTSMPTAGTVNSMPVRPHPTRNASQLSTTAKLGNEDTERVIWHGHLLALKSKGGVRQWKKLWMVVRPKQVAFYKTEEEYAATLIIPMSNLIDAVEIDPISRSKAHCLQIIAEPKSYRFCARDEESLLRCLGAVKSQLAKRKERDAARRAGFGG